MGGMTSYRLSLEEPQKYRGVILMAPAIMNKASSTIKTLAKIVNSIAPKWAVLE